MVTDVVTTKDITSIIDGSGLFDNDRDRLIEQNIDTDTMWLFDADKLNDGIVFEFPTVQKLSSMVVWNYNEPGYVDYGIAKADISAWTAKDGWKQVQQGVVFDKAEGTADYDSPMVVNLNTVEAQKIRFENLSGWNKNGHIGLSEVQFFKPLGPKACNPVPANESEVVYLRKTQAKWTAGQAAVVHEIYLGRAKDKMELLGRIKGPSELTFDGLLPNMRYYWRVDEVSEKGSTSTGPVWSFQTKGQLIAHWPLDDGAGDIVSEKVNSLSGKVRGDSRWIVDETKYDGAMYFDGDGDYIEIPDPALNFSTNAITITGWFKADKNTNDRGLIFSRANGSAAALNLINNELHYHWNDAQQTWDWSSGMELPVGTWAFAAVTVDPDSAVIYLYKNGKLQSSSNTYNHKVEKFDGPLYLAYDPHNTGRYYKGAMDDIRIYDYALSNDEIESLCMENKLTTASKSKIILADVTFVEKGESVKEVAKQAVEEVASELSEPIEPEAGQERSFNLSAVIVIVVVMVIVAVISSSRKKK